MKTHTQLMEIVRERDAQWYDALTSWFANGTIAAVASSLSTDAGNARHLVASALQFYAYIATFNMG